MKAIYPNILACLLVLVTTVPAQNRVQQWREIQTVRFDEPITSWFFARTSFPLNLEGVALSETALTWVGTPGPKSMALPKDYLHTAFSKDGTYFGLGTLRENPNDPSRKFYELQVFTKYGEETSAIRIEHYPDHAISAAIISSTGRVILAQNSTGRLQFHEPTGRLVREVTLFPDAYYDLERFIQVGLSEDGNRVAVLASKRGASPAGSTAPNPSGEPHLFLFNQEGDEIWRKALPHYNPGAMVISPNGKTILASSYTVDMAATIQKSTWLVDDSGRTAGTFDLLFKRQHFSVNSEFVIVADNQQAHIIDVTSSQILRTKSIARQEGMIAAVRVSNDGQLAALLLGGNRFENGAFLFRNPRLKILLQSEKQVQELPLDGTFVTPSLTISPNLDRIVVGLDYGYQLLALTDDN